MREEMHLSQVELQGGRVSWGGGGGQKRNSKKKKNLSLSLPLCSRHVTPRRWKAAMSNLLSKLRTGSSLPQTSVRLNLEECQAPHISRWNIDDCLFFTRHNVKGERALGTRTWERQTEREKEKEKRAKLWPHLMAITILEDRQHLQKF